MTYAEDIVRAEREFSAYNFELADPAALLRIRGCEKECRVLWERPGAVELAAYDQCMKASHCSISWMTAAGSRD